MFISGLLVKSTIIHLNMLQESQSPPSPPSTLILGHANFFLLCQFPLPPSPMAYLSHGDARDLSDAITTDTWPGWWVIPTFGSGCTKWLFTQ